VRTLTTHQHQKKKVCPPVFNLLKQDHILKPVLAKIPEIHIDNLKPNLHGHHLRGLISEQNKIHINQKIIDSVENAEEGSEAYYTYVFLLLATLAHEYAHWLRTQIAPDEETPAAVGYPHARGGAPEGQGESGYVAEISIFNGFIQCDRSPSGAYQNFRMVDRWNVNHHIPIAAIRMYWARAQFEPLTLDNPISQTDQNTYTEVSQLSVTAKQTVRESLRQQIVPPCPCAPFVISPEIQVSDIIDQKPQFDVGNYQTSFEELDIQQVRLRKKQVLIIGG